MKRFCIVERLAFLLVIVCTGCDVESGYESRDEAYCNGRFSVAATKADSAEIAHQVDACAVMLGRVKR